MSLPFGLEGGEEALAYYLEAQLEVLHAYAISDMSRSILAGPRKATIFTGLKSGLWCIRFLSTHVDEGTQ